ncbi:MAG: class I SAM-dependent methyltransferase [bacterium]|nr:class I SAM-dependent methyltransferase [bacterium]
MVAMDYERLATLYDTYVQVDFDRAFFLEEAGKASGEVLELMAGTGRLSIPLAEAGARLTCVDQSAGMLDVLREKLEQRGLSARVHEMDVCDLDLHQRFELILLPLNSFAELLFRTDQVRALRRICEHLTDDGRFICTLHNPPARLRSIDGLLRLWGRFPLSDQQGTLLLWSLENYDPAERTVKGYQFYEKYDVRNALRSKLFVDVQFCLHDRAAFEALAKAGGFRVEVLYGDYSYSPFKEDESDSMIWVLQKSC